MSIVVIVLIALAVLLLIYAVVTYNALVRLRNQAEEAFSDIDVQLKRRHDLIPNLVETVKGYATHERQVFENVTAARTNAVAAQGPGAAGPGREPADRCAAPAVRGRGGLPRPEGEPELPRAPERAHRHRGQDPGLAPLLQHDRARPEHEDRAVPLERRGAVRERAAARVLRAGRSRRPRGARRVVRHRARRKRVSVVQADRLEQAQVDRAAVRLPAALRRARLAAVAVVRRARRCSSRSASRS